MHVSCGRWVVTPLVAAVMQRGETALAIALKKDNCEYVDLFLANGANVNKTVRACSECN